MKRNEASVPMAAMERSVERLLGRCEQRGECMVIGVRHPQLRVTVAPKSYVTISANRAVFAVHNGRRPDPDIEVAPSCGTGGCLNPLHLVEMASSAAAWGAYRSSTVDGLKRAAKKQIKYSDRKIESLRALVEDGTPIRDAAKKLRMVPASAYKYVQAHYSRNHRTIPHGSYDNPLCSRCGEYGHYRNRGCLQAQESA